MIKGRYVAQIEVDFEYDSKQPKITFDELHERVHGGWLDDVVGKAVGEIFSSGKPRIVVTRQYADVVEKEEKHE